MLWITTSDASDLKLELTITLDVDSGGWLVEMTTPRLGPSGEPTYSRTVIPMHAIEQGTSGAYIDALLVMHMKFLGFT